MQTSQTIATTTDVAIVGGGVAGASLAAALAGAGLDVVIIEREPRFRDRVRGEGIHPWGVREAEALGLLPPLRAAGAHELPSWQVYRGREPVYAFRWDDDAPGRPGEWSIYHPALQTALLEHAADRGAQVLRPARVSSLLRDNGPRLTVETQDGPLELRARLVVGADGRQSATRRWLDAEAIHDTPVQQIGGCLLDDVALDEQQTHYAVFEGGFVLLYPQGHARARCYVVCSAALAAELRGNAARFIGQCAAALPEGALGPARAIGPLAFFPAADIWCERVAGDDVVLLGDAAGANDPSRGQGLSICFRDARELRDALLDDDDWQRAIARFADRRATYYAALRADAQWSALLTSGVGPEADTRRARAERARQLDPELGGYASIIGAGPDGLVVNEATRRHFFGEDLPPEG
jgi:menaquinone-9 beta-reductase